MNYQNHLSRFLFAAGVGILAVSGVTQSASAAEPYKIVNTSKTMGTGGIDYVYAPPICNTLQSMYYQTEGMGFYIIVLIIVIVCVLLGYAYGRAKTHYSTIK